jgi:hypothetical protein
VLARLVADWVVVFREVVSDAFDPFDFRSLRNGGKR